MPTYLAALGMTGMTAYFGLFDVGALAEGETVAVSGAAGAVGSVVGQLAKIKGCRVVGIAGGPEKCAFVVDELGFDAAVDYRAGNVAKDLRAAAPDGIDVYFDNVGGEVLDAALAGCAGTPGWCSAGRSPSTTPGQAGRPGELHEPAGQPGPDGGLPGLRLRRPLRRGGREMAVWLGEGRLRSEEHVVRGAVTDFGATLQQLFRGENTGKLILQIGD
jgi:NADPH-dependent curcumin reductase CurA